MLARLWRRSLYRTRRTAELRCRARLGDAVHLDKIPARPDMRMERQLLRGQDRREADIRAFQQIGPDLPGPGPQNPGKGLLQPRTGQPAMLIPDPGRTPPPLPGKVSVR